MAEITLGELIEELAHFEPQTVLYKAVIRMQPPTGMGLDVLYTKPKVMRDEMTGALVRGRGIPLKRWVAGLRAHDPACRVWAYGVSTSRGGLVHYVGRHG